MDINCGHRLANLFTIWNCWQGRRNSRNGKEESSIFRWIRGGDSTCYSIGDGGGLQARLGWAVTVRFGHSGVTPGIFSDVAFRRVIGTALRAELITLSETR